MTIKELKEMLENYPEDYTVWVNTDYSQNRDKDCSCCAIQPDYKLEMITLQG